MRLTITRSGGFAGQEAEEIADVETSRLGPARARQAEEAVRGLQERPSEVGADLIRYEIAIEDGHGQRTVSATDDGDPKNPLYTLLDSVSQR